jgi:hypothetical protein
MMSDAPHEARKPDMTRLIGAMLAKRRPPIFEVGGKAQFLPLPTGQGFAVPVMQMRDEPERFS